MLGLLMCAVAIGLVACGSSGNSSSSSGSSSTSESESGSSGSSETTATSSTSCRIGLSNGVSNSAEQSLVAREAERRASEIGCSLVLGTASGDPAKQFDEVQQWIQTKQVDAVVFLPTGGNPTPLMEQAKAAGIPIIGYAGPFPGTSGAINYDQELAGEQLASAAVKWAKENFPGEKIKDYSYGIFTFDECGTPCTTRTDPMMAAMKKELGVEPVSNQTAYTEEVGLEAGEGMLSAHPELSSIIGIGDGGVLGALKAVEGAGREDEMFLGGIGGAPETLEVIAAGGAYKATAATLYSEIGDAIINVPAGLLKTGKAPNVTIKTVLVETPQEAKELLKTYEEAEAAEG
jgi:ribose transport system substrate-binding protein